MKAPLRSAAGQRPRFVRKAWSAIVEHIEDYCNRRRLHSTLGYRSPAHLEASYPQEVMLPNLVTISERPAEAYSGRLLSDGGSRATETIQAPAHHLASPDDLWCVVERVLAELDLPKRTGRKRIDLRGALDAITFRLRSGCQWNRLPSEFSGR